MSATPPIAFLSGSAGPGEMVVIFLLILVLFGPRRLPEIAKMIGKTLHELRKASEDFKDQVMAIETDVVELVDDAVKSDLIEEDDDFGHPEEDEDYDWSVPSDESDPYADDYDSDIPVEPSDSGTEEPLAVVDPAEPVDQSDDESSRDKVS